MTVRVSGFTFVRDAVRLDYPLVESICSILPIVDEFVVNLGACTDDTEDLVRSISSPKLRILRSEWNDYTNTGGYVYAQQTNVALFNCRGKWAFYLQADEVIHEDDLPHLVEEMDRYGDDPRVDSLALEQIDFWGDYRTRLEVWPWAGSYRCRVVKPHHFVLSRGDALGFTVHPKYKERGRRPRAVETEARQFHYSGLKSIATLQAKQEVAARWWSERTVDWGLDDDKFYRSIPRCFVGPYPGTHPHVMQQRIAEYPFAIDLDSPRWRKTPTVRERRLLLKHHLRQVTGGRGFRRGCYGRVA